MNIHLVMLYLELFREPVCLCAGLGAAAARIFQIKLLTKNGLAEANFAYVHVKSRKEALSPPGLCFLVITSKKAIVFFIYS